MSTVVGLGLIMNHHAGMSPEGCARFARYRAPVGPLHREWRRTLQLPVELDCLHFRKLAEGHGGGCVADKPPYQLQNLSLFVCRESVTRNRCLATCAHRLRGERAILTGFGRVKWRQQMEVCTMRSCSLWLYRSKSTAERGNHADLGTLPDEQQTGDALGPARGETAP